MVVDIKLEDKLVEAVLEIAKKRKPYKKYNTYSKAVRDALEFFIESHKDQILDNKNQEKVPT
jgi:metal-responsive CopG/Arc/MetJ family transcriptional regulator